MHKMLRKEYRAMPMNYKLIASDALDKYNGYEVQNILKHHISPAVSWPIKVGVLFQSIFNSR